MNKAPLYVLMLILLPFQSMQLFAAENDIRFQVRVQQVDGELLTVNEAMRLALPMLWSRVVPKQSLAAATRLKGRTSLVLQFKKVSRGAFLVFNPIQVQSYLQGFGIVMIPMRPQWNLDITVQGFGDSDKNIAAELVNYSYSIADKSGFELSPRGRNLHLIFSPVVDEYGESKVHVGLAGAFPPSILSQADQSFQGYLSYQLQSWTDQILHEIRDVYSKGSLDFLEVSSEVLITIVNDLPLASQVSLEKLLVEEPSVVAVIPVLLQQASQLYRIVLRDGDDSWLGEWFSAYGLVAIKQSEGSASQWLVQ